MNEFITQALELLSKTQFYELILEKNCAIASKLGDKGVLKKWQKLLILFAKYRFAGQILTGIADVKSKPPINVRKLTFLFNILTFLNLRHTNNPNFLIEAVILEM
jgi:hypothetical protein